MSFLSPATPRGRRARQRAIGRTIKELDMPAMLSNIMDTYRAATPAYYDQGVRWYWDAYSLADEDPVHCAVLAALSPGCDWNRNVDLAEEMIITGDCPHPYGNAIDKARAVLAAAKLGTDPSAPLGGRKVRSFYRNIRHADRPGPVTIDRHAASIALLGPSAHKGGRRTATLSDKDLQIIDRAGAYTLIASAYRSVARDLGLLPHELQAIVWCYWRDQHAYSTTTTEEF